MATAAWMWHCTEIEQLWGHAPLFLFGSAWAGWQTWRSPKTPFSWQAPEWKPFIWSSISGIMLAAAFPPYPTAWIAFFAWIPWLMMAHGIMNDGAPKPLRRLFRYSYHTMLTWNIIATFWVANTALIAGLFAFVMNAFLMCLPLVAWGWIYQRTNKVHWMALVSFWLTFEYIHLRWELSWTWLTLGNAFASLPSWIQWYEFTGVFGGSLWIWLINIFIFLAWQQNTTDLKKYLKPVLAVLLPIATSLALYFTYTPQGSPVEAVVIQPNFEPHYEKFSVGESAQMQQFLRLSDSLVTPQTQYLIFPETSFGSVEVEPQASQSVLITLRQYLDKHPSLKLVMGLGAYRKLDPTEADTPFSRTFERKNGNGFRYEVFNAGAQMESGQTDIQWYYKSKLVPGAEFVPYPFLFFWAKPVVDALDGSMQGHATQAEREVFTSSTGKIGPAICYESVYGEYYTGYVRTGAQLMAIMTNDGWWDCTAGHKQHLAYASLRAIETRRDIVRSANTGVSAFIDQKGGIHQATEYGVATGIRGQVLLNDQVTFYTRWGDLIGRIGLFVALLVGFNGISRGLGGKR